MYILSGVGGVAKIGGDWDSDPLTQSKGALPWPVRWEHWPKWGSEP